MKYWIFQIFSKYEFSIQFQQKFFVRKSFFTMKEARQYKSSNFLSSLFLQRVAFSNFFQDTTSIYIYM